jgi:ketosteroid isomerase-like protein
MMSKSRENVRIIKDFYRALSNGDSGYVQDVLAPEIDWAEPAAEGLPFAGRHHGPRAVFKEVLDVIHDNIREFEFKPRKVFAVGDVVVVMGHSTGRGRITDLKLNAAGAHLWTLSSGKAVKFQALHDSSKWLEALGPIPAEQLRYAA